MQTVRFLARPVNALCQTRAGLSVALVLALLAQMIAPGLAASPKLNFTLDPDRNVFTRLVESSLPAVTSGQQALRQMPLSFTLNQGQTDARVKFTARGRGYNLFLTPIEAVLQFQGANSLGSTALRMQLLRSNNNPVISGLEPLPMVSNYYLGNDPSKYRTNVPHFAKVKYEQVYPGIDLVYYGNQNDLEYDFIVAPGVDPNVIQMNFAGASKLRLADNGDLRVSTKGGELRQHKPIIYQTINGARKEIAGHFVVKGKQVSFALGTYDTTKELVIDPTLTYSTYLGGVEGDEKAYSVAVAAGCTGACDSYITGEVASLTFPDTTIGSPAGGKDVFVAKMNPAGTGVAFFTFLGDTGDEHGRGIKTDASGNSYVVGIMGSNYNPAAPGLQPTDPYPNNEDAFVAKLDATGGLACFTYLGGSNFDQANAIVLDGTNIAVTGQTYSSNFPTTMTAYDTSYNGGHDVFVSKLTNTLATMSYSTYVGGGNMDYGNGIDVYNGILYVVGNTQSTNFPTSTNGFDKTLTGFAPVDAFVLRLDPAVAGTTGLLYSTYLGGNGREYGYGIAVNPNNGQFYITGRSHSPGASTTGYVGTSNGFPVTASALQATQVGYGDVFLTRFNINGGIVYSTLFGGSDYDCAYGIEVRGTTAYIVGETDSSSAGTPFPITGDRFQDDQPGTDAFIARIDTNVAGALGLVFSTYYGGGDPDFFDVRTDSARGIAMAGAQAYVVGFTNSGSTASGGSFPIKPAVPYQEDNAGQGAFDCFVVRLTP